MIGPNSETDVTLISRHTALALFCAALAFPVGAEAQLPPPVTQLPAPVPVPPLQPVAVPAPQQLAPAATPAPLPPPLWTIADAKELLNFVSGIGGEGLDPSDYNPDGLAKALNGGDPIALGAVASASFDKLSSDLALGRVRGKDRIDWHIKDPDLDNGRQDQLLHWAVQTHQVAQTLSALLPTHPQYAALRHALAVTPATETAKIGRIRLNMDRWRWLPQNLGTRYIIVNVPAYTAALVEDGETKSRHHAVAGKISTPTPQISATATGVILNPWWEVPASIADSVAGKKGFVAVRGADGKVQRWRQPPGPSNALGEVKFVMPNPLAIYLHDTNAKSRFNSRVRAFSHGCIRTDKIMDLATILLTEGGDDWTADRIKETLASGKTVKADFPKPLPVYIVYMSTAATVDGKIIDYPDIYKRDTSVIASLADARSPAKASDKIATR